MCVCCAHSCYLMQKSSLLFGQDNRTAGSFRKLERSHCSAVACLARMRRGRVHMRIEPEQMTKVGSLDSGPMVSQYQQC